jgi:hypothetical protein
MNLAGEDLKPDRNATVITFLVNSNRVADPHHFNADPDPAFNYNADPDPAFHFSADPDPAFTLMRIRTASK